jgi:hypothetical protein
MVYFRVAMRIDAAARWQWRSTTLTSLNALFSFLKVYERVARDRTRVFFASSSRVLNEMLVRENSGRVSNSMTVEELWQERGKIDKLEMMHLEAELAMRKSRQLVASSGSSVTAELPARSLKTRPLAALPKVSTDDRMYDTPYVFTLPTATKQALAWARLLTRVQNGELVP